MLNPTQSRCTKSIIQPINNDPLCLVGTRRTRVLGSIAISLGGVITTNDDQILRSVVMLARKVRLEDRFGTIGVSLLSIEGGTRHVWNHGVSTTEWVLCVAEWVVLWCWLWEPDITSVTAEVAGSKSLGNIFLDDDGTTGGVNQPGSLLHLGDQLLVEETASLLVERAVDGDNITLSKHLLQSVDSATSNLCLDLWAEWLVIIVQQLLAVECLQSSQDTLSNSTNGNGTDDLTLEIELVLGSSGNIPLSGLDLLVGRDEVTDKDQDGHDDVLGDGDNVGTSDFGNGDTTVGLVGGVEIDVVRSNTGSDGDLEVLGLGKTLSSEVTRVETTRAWSLVSASLCLES